MIVSHLHKYIFLKTRKTAGTSLEIGLSEHCGPDDIITAISAEDEALRASLGFRGPQNHLMSYDRAKALRGDRGGPKKQRELINHETAETVRALVGAATWASYFKFTIERDPFDKAISRYWWDQREATEQAPMSAYLASVSRYKISNWLIYTIENEIAVDHVIRFENLAAEVATLAERLNTPPINLIRVKDRYRGDRRHYSEVLSDADRRRIEGLCADEMAAFGYRWSAHRPAEPVRQPQG